MKITLKLLLVIFLFVTCSKDEDRQITIIPDSNFEQSLIDLGIDNDGTINQQVFTSRISTIDSLSVNSKNISDLAGIEDFTSLTYLECWGNQLTSLDVSNNTSLIELRCSGNQLTSLDLSKNTSLEEIYCEYNLLTNLDLSKNTNLKGFLCGFNQLTSLNFGKNTNLIGGGCYFNQLTSLDVSQNTSLEYLQCQGNQFTNLDVSFNTLSMGFDCRFMPLLTCIKVNQSQLDNIPSTWIKDTDDYYALVCN